MVQAQRMGVTEEWVRKVAVANPTRHQLFLVRKIDCGPSNGRPLQAQDIILTLNGQLITRVSDFDIMFDKESLNALVVRQGKELRLTVPTAPTGYFETQRAVVFCGAVLQKPH